MEKVRKKAISGRVLNSMECLGNNTLAVYFGCQTEMIGEKVNHVGNSH
jgi:hypothetical protein